MQKCNTLILIFKINRINGKEGIISIKIVVIDDSINKRWVIKRENA